MEGQLNKAFHLVAQPNNQAIKQGEHLLGLLKKNQAYPIALLHYMNSQSVSNEGKLRAAIELKLWAQSFKEMEEYEQGFYSQVIESIKESILHAYLNFPSQISKTLQPGIVCLTDVLFPRRWDKLIQILLGYASQNNQSIGAILQLLQSITHKYTILSRSDALYEEIIKVCNEAHDQLKDLTTNVLQIVIANPNANEAAILETLMKLFYNLNYQDLHPKYEDNLGHWMNVLKAVMKLPNASEHIFKCKGAAVQAILLYSNKYKEDVEQSIKDFCVQIWPLCASASEDQELDSIVFNCLKFFKSMLNWSDMKPFFQEHMNQFFESLILPNIAPNKTASALFEDEPEVFIDFYFRNTEVQTRRAAAIELLRIICRSYNTFQGFLETQISNFMALPSKSVVAQCTLLGLVIDGSSKGFRDIDGCTQLFVDVRIIHFCYNSIAKTTLGNIYSWAVENPKGLVEDRFNALHVTIIIRFFFYFRVYFPKEELGSLLQCFSKLRTKNESLRRAIQMVANGYLIIKHGDYDNYRNLVTFFNPENLRPVAVDIFTLIYEGTIEQSFLQDGLTKMFLNIVRGLQQVNSQFFSYQLEIMKEMLKKTERFDFNSAQFLFETIGFLAYYYIRANSPDKPVLEKTVLDFFQAALISKSDLLNFSLQVVAIFLQLEPVVNQSYLNIYQSLLMEENWKEQNQSVMSSSIQFIIAFLGRFRERLISDKPAIELILSKIIQIDHIQLFFRFLEAIMQKTSLEEFNRSGYMSIFVRGSQALGQSIQGRKATLLFISKLIVHYGDHMTALQMLNSYCSNFYDQLLAASADILKSISARRDRKFIFLAVCKAIDSNYFRNAQLEGGIFEQLISNTVDRFAIRNISSQVQESDAKEKKEATYRKLQVFKEFENPQMDPQVDEEEMMVRTFRNVGGDRGLLQFISERNRDRIMRLNDKYSK